LDDALGIDRLADRYGAGHRKSMMVIQGSVMTMAGILSMR
jgi:hypothetical protein